MQVHGVLIMTLLKMLYFLVLIIVYHPMLTITKIIFSARWRVNFWKLWFTREKALIIIIYVLILVKQTQNCVWLLYYNTDNSYFLVNGKEILTLKPTIEILTFQLSIVLEVYLMDLMLVNLEKYLQIESSLIFQPITILVVDLTYYACASI